MEPKNEGLFRLIVVFSVLFCILNLNADAESRFVNLPDGSKCFDDRFVVVLNPGSPALPLNQSSDGIASTGIFSIDKLCRENKVIRVDTWYPYAIRHDEVRELVERMYVFFLADGQDVLSAAAGFAGDASVQISEPWRIPEIFLTPNDPLRSNQWFLGNVSAYTAWNIISGDPTMQSVIGIVDTGVYYNHPDLSPNMWEGIGWDVADNDADPSEPYPIHGTWVAGCASEATDNGIGGAGLGWSARIMAVKGGDSGGNLTHVYQGILWASDNDAHVINCSWGSIGYSNYEQSVINTAYSRGSLVVAAAGNDDYWTPPYVHYPSAYNHVLAVAATNQSNDKAGFSNYGTWVDVSAPGVSIYSTWGPNTYTSLSGTSGSSPITAGLAALVHAVDPSLTHDQIADFIIDYADPMDDYYYNQGWMGSGRIDAFASVSAVNPLDAPDLSSPLDGVFIANHYPTFTWNSVPNATVYHLQVDQSSSFTSPEIDNSNINQTTYTSQVFLADGTWYWRVRAGDGSDWGNWSDTWSFGIDTQGPSSVTLLVPAYGEWVNDDTPYFSWTAATDGGSGVDFYEIEVDDEPLFNPPHYLDGTTANTNYTPVGNLPGNAVYHWRVRARDLAGNYGSYATSIFGIDSTPPSGCTASSSPISGELNFPVYWSTGSDGGSGLSGLYDVRFKDGDAGPWTDWYSGYDLSSIFTGQHNHIYYFEARTSDMAGNQEPFSGVAETETLVDTEFVAPPCNYVTGDVNGDGFFSGSDIIFGVNRLFRAGPAPEYECDCPPHGTWPVAGDVNADCVFSGGDIIYGVNNIFGGGPGPVPCPDCPPTGRLRPHPGESPADFKGVPELPGRQ